MTYVLDGLKNERGENLLSVAAAMMILTIAGLVALPIVMGSRSQVKGLKENSFCRDLSQNILAQIRSNGLQTKVYRAPSTANSITFNDTQWRNNTTMFGNINRGGVVSEYGIGPALESTRWPAQRVMRWNGTQRRFVSNAPRLLYSAMNLLQAVNNGFGNRACTQAKGIAIDSTSGLASLLSPATLATYAEAGYFVQASIKTVPFKVIDETVLPCDPNLQLRPFGIQEPPMTDVFRITDGFGTRYRSDHGIQAEAFVTVDHIDPQLRGGKFLKECSTSERFQFNRVISQIPFPQFDVSGNLRVTLDSPPAVAPRPRRSLTGLFLACTYEYQISTATPFSAGLFQGNLNRWVPCEQVSVCGGGPPRITESEFQIEYQFDRSPPANCSFSMRVMAYDAVGNSLYYPSYLHCFGSGPNRCCEEEGTSAGCGGGRGRPAYQ